MRRHMAAKKPFGAHPALAWFTVSGLFGSPRALSRAYESRAGLLRGPRPGHVSDGDRFAGFPAEPR